ncbi:hypothetical protein KKA95_01595 [Patescibacteria group bacterium]|nr:hypothetical protein [Patescibacteria group bacterium]
MNIITFLRSFRIGPFAIFDFAVTYLIAFLIGPYLKKLGIPISREQLMWLALPISVLIHAIFKIKTPLTEMVFDPSGHYTSKVIMIAMIIMAIVRK